MAKCRSVSPLPARPILQNKVLNHPSWQLGCISRKRLIELRAFALAVLGSETFWLSTEVRLRAPNLGDNLIPSLMCSSDSRFPEIHFDLIAKTLR